MDRFNPTAGTPSRRAFLKAGAAAGLFLALGPHGHPTHARDSAAAGLKGGVFLHVAPDGGVRITPPTAELGQGAHNALPRILADELGARWSDVEVGRSYAHPGFVADATGRQRTAGSEGVKVYFEQLRRVGACAREMLCAAAAARWGVAAADCEARDSRVHHPPSGREASFAALAVQASGLPVPASPRLKGADAFTLIGRRLPRKDIEEKVAGKAVFGIDVRAPDLLHAAVAMPAVAGAAITAFDAGAAESLRGVHTIVAIDGAVAVVADSFWRAKQAASRIDIESDPGDATALNSDAMREALLRSLDDDDAAVQFPNVDTQAGKPAMTPLDRGAMETAMAEADQVLEWHYEVPYLAHLALEPMVCTALVADDRCHVWAPSQHPDGGHALVAELTGLPPEKIRFDITYVGGGFGRKFELDVVRQAVQIALQVPGRPVKLTWTREQDVQHDFYRPAFAVRTRTALRDGAIAGMHSRIAGQSIWRFQGKNQLPHTADPTAAALLVSDIYDFPGKYIDFVEAPWRLPVGLWRSVTLSQNAFFAEAAIDEAAHALGRDPYRFRRAMLGAHPRIVRVLDAAARLADWDRERGPGRGLGIAVSQGFGSLCVQVVEAAVDGDRLEIPRINCVLDCGLQVDPATIRAQLEGGIIFGLSAALRGEITFDGGAVVESNFDNHPILRMNEIPDLAIELVQSDAPPGGVGEAGVPPVAPALANAIFAASGRRIRRLPLARAGLTL